MKLPFLIILILILGFIFLQIYFFYKLKSKKGKIIEVDDKEFNQLIKKNNKLMLYFWTESCSACKRQTPIINNLKMDFHNLFLFNLTNNPSLARKLGILTVPTILIIEYNKITDVLIGVQDEDKLRSMLKNIGY